MPETPTPPAPKAGLVGEIALFLGRELDEIDRGVTPWFLRTIHQTRKDWRLEGEGLRQLATTLRYDVTSLLYEYQRLISGSGEPPAAPPAVPGGDLVSIQGALSRPDLPREEPAAPEEPPPDPDAEGLFHAGRRGPAGNFRCLECDAVITQPRAALLPPCECGGQGWRHLE